MRMPLAVLLAMLLAVVSTVLLVVLVVVLLAVVLAVVPVLVPVVLARQRTAGLVGARIKDVFCAPGRQGRPGCPPTVT